MPENIGLKMEVDDGLRVQKVTPGSAAAQAGLQPGDELTVLNGQRLLSQADIQWVLHQAPAETKLNVAFVRDGKPMNAVLTLTGSWKQGDLSWRESSWYGLRHALHTEVLTPAQKKQRNLPPDRMALVVKNMYGGAQTAPLRKAGVGVGDVVVAVDGKDDLLSETQFLVYVRLHHRPGDTMAWTVLRGGQRHELKVPAW